MIPHLPHPMQDASTPHGDETGAWMGWDEEDTSAGVGQRHSTEPDPFNEHPAGWCASA